MEGNPMLNYLWAAMMIIGVVWGAVNGRMEDVTNGALDSAKDAVTLCITMLGVMSLWTGLMEVASSAGIIKNMTKKNSALDPLSVSFTPQKSSGPGIHQCQLYRQFSRPGLGRHPRRHQSHAGTIRSGRGTPRPKFSAVRSSPYCQQRNVYIFDPEYFLPPADTCQSHRLPEPIWKRQPCLHRRPCHPCHRHQHPCLYHFL